MSQKNTTNLLFTLLFGVFLIVIVILGGFSYWYDLTHVPFNMPLFIGIVFLIVPIAISFIIQAILGFFTQQGNNKKEIARVGLEKKYYLIYCICYLTCLFISLSFVFTTIVFYWNAIIIEMDEPIFVGLISIYIGGCLWLITMTMEFLAKSKGNSILFNLSDKSEDMDNMFKNRKDHNLSLRITQVWSFLIILLISCASTGLVIIGEPETCFKGINSFSAPAYDLPSAPHYNTTLDDDFKVNQTILIGFEKVLRNMTRLQKMGGFPMGSKLDGTLMWSDRGETCPLFPDEFSLQGGTARVASVYLEMYKVEPNPIYLEVALEAADALLAVQDDINGGFFYDGRRYQNGVGYQPHPRNQGRHAVFDDNVMQSCLSFLLDVYNLTGIQKYYNAFFKGIDLIFAVEKPGGGWPQRTGFPSYRYEDYITLNDNSMGDIVNLLLKAYRMFPWETRYLAAAERAGQFLIRVQGNGGSPFQQGWAQQYYMDLPAWARNFEPPAICSSDTDQAINILMELYLVTNNKTYLKPIPAAISWLNDTNTIISWIEDSEIKIGWSRLYELGTNLPIYGIADGGIDKSPPYVYNYNEARSGYNWRNTNANKSAEQYLKLQEFNNDSSLFLEWRNTPKDLNYLYKEAREAYDDLDSSYFWLDNGKIKDSIFTSNSMKIVEYLKMAIST